jgi:type I restriction enzyme M protein
MAKYLNPTLKDFDRQICLINRHNKRSVFFDFLTWIIAGFAVSDELKWQPKNRYNDKELSIFSNIFKAFVLTLNSEIKADDHWCDLLGIYYEGADFNDSYKGQFFTPEHICTLMAKITIGDERRENHAYDCCCGSGRMLLAANSIQPGMKLYASDLDAICCQITIINFLMHGCEGEVVHKNGLIDDCYFEGWAVNDGLNNPFSKYYGLPHVRILPKEESEIYKRGLLVKKEFNNVPVKIVSKNKVKETTVPRHKQLELF